ncbi:hypothetical protein [Salinimicrobium sp. TH3]|uniref:hypothetical protein n=1 Tax=Salinimicrobium sp. TH3 TaxID=2997342 RepID=UPI002273EFF6|nr:hypothetical protein [Salinimicrobium sp. TH3]MCY2687846.1 hypothetical protein [Salinimicrobium sp. TH3]
MIKKIRNKITRFESRLDQIYQNLSVLDQKEKIQKQNQQIQFDFHQISQLFSRGEFIPWTSWSISPSTILHVLNDLLVNEKKSVIEFGAGSSTFYIAKFLKEHQLENVQFLTVESDERWIGKIEKWAGKYELLDHINIVHSPITDVQNELSWKNQTKWYSSKDIENAFNREEKFDLILIDGPWGGISPFGRYSAVPFLKNNLSEKFSIYLDDTFREEEFKIINKWSQLLDTPVKHYNKYSLLTNEDRYNIEPFSVNKWQKV